MPKDKTVLISDDVYQEVKRHSRSHSRDGNAIRDLCTRGLKFYLQSPEFRLKIMREEIRQIENRLSARQTFAADQGAARGTI